MKKSLSSKSHKTSVLTVKISPEVCAMLDRCEALGLDQNKLVEACLNRHFDEDVVALKMGRGKETAKDRLEWIHKLELTCQNDAIGTAFLGNELVYVTHHEGEEPKIEGITLRESVERYKDLFTTMETTGNVIDFGPGLEQWLDTLANELPQ